MVGLVDAVANTIKDRSGEFRDQIRRRVGGITGDARGIGHSLELFVLYTEHIDANVEADRTRPIDDDVKLQLLRAHLEHLNERIALFDDRFSRGHQQVPRFLITAVEERCEEMFSGNQQAVLTIGPPGNFGMIVDDLKTLLFKDLLGMPTMPQHLLDFNPVMISLPSIEGVRVPWQPVSLGHEFAHYLQSQRPIALRRHAASMLDVNKLDNMNLPVKRTADPVSKLRNMEIIVSKWQDELICDAYAVHRYGPAGVAALAEFLNGIGGADLRSDTHPPGFLRVELMLKWLDLDSVPNGLKSIVAPFIDMAAPPADPFDPDDRIPEWVEYLSGVLRDVSDDIWADVHQWIGIRQYDYSGRVTIIEWLAERLSDGIPGGEVATLESGDAWVDAIDVVNGCWLSMANEAQTPVQRLAGKALDTLDFLNKWSAAGGDMPEATVPATVIEKPGTLSKESIISRLNSKGKNRLLVTPAMKEAVEGCGLDVRLGNHFIIFHQSSAAAFDALDKTQDPRNMQYAIEKAWGETFYLHPNQLVLAATLEYIVLPDDLAAEVATRSSYGRLGMLSATAVKVHPSYMGCLTLELVNLGEMPLSITPGERIAQLVFNTTSTPVAPPSNPKYKYPTAPEFSKVRGDKESDVLRRMRQNFRERRFTTN